MIRIPNARPPIPPDRLLCELLPCLMTPDAGYDMRQGRFAAGWNGVIQRFVSRAAPAGFACRDCRLKWACGYCPAYFRIETGREDQASEWMCRVGALRTAKIEECARGTGANEHQAGRNEAAARVCEATV